MHSNNRIISLVILKRTDFIHKDIKSAENFKGNSTMAGEVNNPGF
jgi:hypothetical protein